MVNKAILDELKFVVEQRGEVTREQREYAMAEEKIIAELHPITRPSEEKRTPQFRTLESYIGPEGVRTLVNKGGLSISSN